jgi:hypothetical protein
MQNKTRLVVGVLAAGVVGAGGTALTASNTVPANTAGYGSQTVSGAEVTDVEHTLSGDGTRIVSTHLVFVTDLTPDREVYAGFGTAPLEQCTVDVDLDEATCTYALTGYSTAGETEFVVAVS